MAVPLADRECTLTLATQLLMVSVQFLFQIALCALAAKLRPDLNLSSRALAWDVWAQTTGSLGLLTGLDIGVSNVALRTISLSSYTIIKVRTSLVGVR